MRPNPSVGEPDQPQDVVLGATLITIVLGQGSPESKVSLVARSCAANQGLKVLLCHWQSEDPTLVPAERSRVDPTRLAADILLQFPVATIHRTSWRPCRLTPSVESFVADAPQRSER